MHRLVLPLLCIAFATPEAFAAEQLTQDEASAALRRAVGFFRSEVSCNGGYLWRYSADLARREGEGRASETTAWVQPPGTPTVGEALLTAFELTDEPYLLEAARETAGALVRGQLRSGGWDYRIEFASDNRQRYAYRIDGGGNKARNTSTLDDNTTQAALGYLMRIDRILNFEDTSIHGATQYALEKLLETQYPNGAWPQRFSQPPNPAEFPIRKASYPETWPRTHPKTDYRNYYTFNDNSIADTISTMLAAAETYEDVRFRESAKKGGHFILLAQLPEPQPAWAQQYDGNMHPAWARRFEPPAVTGGESQGVMRILMNLYTKTGDRQFLKPIPPALKYFQKSSLPDGRLARFYELKTNRPLYFTKDYQLTYEDTDLPTHYAFQVGSSLKTIQTQYERLLATDPDKLNPPAKKPTFRMSPSLEKRAQEVIAGMDSRGAWVQSGSLRYHGDEDPTTHVIDCRTFIANVQALSRFIAACD